MEFYANMHFHSTHSDGVYSPKELVIMARNEGYSAVALTDHDTVTGCAEAEAECRRQGMEFVFGAEFTVVRPKGYHMVAFNFDPGYPAMQRYIEERWRTEADQTRQIFENAVRTGAIAGITWDEVLAYNDGIRWLCNDHVWRAMLAKGLVREEDYMTWFNRNFRHQRGLIPPLYDFLDAKGLIDLVHAAGGVVLLAHPKHQLDDIPALVNIGLDGLEVWHSNLRASGEEERALRIGQEMGLLISGGSDHEGLMGGYYSSYPTLKALHESNSWLEPHSVGTTEEYFRRIQRARH